MLHIVIYLIHQSIPVLNITTAFLKVGRLDNVLKQHRIEMKRVVGPPQGQQVLGSIVLGSKGGETSVRTTTQNLILSTHWRPLMDLLCLLPLPNERALPLAVRALSHFPLASTMPISTFLGSAMRQQLLEDPLQIQVRRKNKK